MFYEIYTQLWVLFIIFIIIIVNNKRGRQCKSESK